ncbi:hypothetical protein JMM81_11685 [Bacillus sp. V3B]|uniref:hypothetical protein n=1 Tax=Bacillus sp. V3B TaxID=2804915 RepID=UPI00210E3B3F|nr:hypothetical protein [Bacillus sp. V3B]MCQ6275619.1 hypothetical protein [Bacillus sp. V3B]
MVKLIKLWVMEINRKKNLQLLMRELCFSFYIKIEKSDILLKIENGHILLDEKATNECAAKVIEGKEELFLSILLGEQKLREAVKKRELSTTCSYRELLLLESLFYLAKPNLFMKS